MFRSMTAVAITGLASATSAHAFDFDPNVFSFNGFGTLGAVYSSEDQAIYTGPGFKARGAGYENQISMDVDSRLGVQAIAKFSDKLTGTVQLVAEQNSHGDYAPEIEWANLKYSFTPDFSVRVGRTAMPSYLFSDTRKVGYAITWERTPYEVYNLLPITNSDGVDMSYKLHIGSATNTIQAIYGENLQDVGGGLTIKAKDVWGVFDTFEIGNLTAKVTYQEQELYFGSYKNSLFPPAPVQFVALGANYDTGKWFAAAEWARRKIDGNFIGGVIKAWYVSGGVRIGNLTPYATIAESKPEEAPFFGYSTDQRSYAVGSRWDFMRNFNLKAEYQLLDLPKGSQGMLIVPSDPLTMMPLTQYQPGGSVNLFSVSINFVF
ncbi:MAG TPA: porin [Steroidobacteraceae bacterium]|nr:porin [Steroidobacteraceae bacterium]